MKRVELSTINEWLNWDSNKPHAIVTVLHSGRFPPYGRVPKEEIEQLISKLVGLPVYLGHQVTPEDRIGTVEKAWQETDNLLEIAKAKIDIDPESQRYKKLKELWEAGTCDSVSLQFNYTELGSGELADMTEIKPLELSVVEKAVCKDCKIDTAKFGDNEDEVKEVSEEKVDYDFSDKEIRLQHISSLADQRWEGKDEHRRLQIKGIALKPGIFNDVEYDWDALKNSAPSLIGQTISVDHSKSVHDVVGKVTNAWPSDKEQTIYFEGYIDHAGVAEKINRGLLDAISPEVKSTPIERKFPLKVTDVLFTGISIVARPACKGCRLTTKSANYLKKLQNYYEAGELETKNAQQNEKYIKDNRTNSSSTVSTENNEGGNTVTDEKILKEVQSELVEEPGAENAVKTASDLPKKDTETVPVKDEAKPEKKTELSEETEDDVEIVEAEETEDEMDETFKPLPPGQNRRTLYKKLPNGKLLKISFPRKAATILVNVDGWTTRPPIIIKPPKNGLVVKKLEEEATGANTKYSELEAAHTGLLAENINVKEQELGYQVSENRLEDLKGKSPEVLTELWASIKDVKAPAKFGEGPKGETTVIPHGDESGEQKDENPMLDAYNDL